MGWESDALPPALVDDGLRVADVRLRAWSAMRLRSAAITIAEASSSRSFQLALLIGVITMTSWMPLASACTCTGPRLWTDIGPRLEGGIAVGHGADEPAAVAAMSLECRRGERPPSRGRRDSPAGIRLDLHRPGAKSYGHPPARRRW